MNFPYFKPRVDSKEFPPYLVNTVKSDLIPVLLGIPKLTGNQQDIDWLQSNIVGCIKKACNAVNSFTKDDLMIIIYLYQYLITHPSAVRVTVYEKNARSLLQIKSKVELVLIKIEEMINSGKNVDYKLAHKGMWLLEIVALIDWMHKDATETGVSTIHPPEFWKRFTVLNEKINDNRQPFLKDLQFEV